MSTRRADDLRAKAKDLYAQAKTIADDDERLAVILRGVECEMEADSLERKQGVTQVQQQGTQPPPPLPAPSESQPAQQQQQIQPEDNE